MSITTRTLGAVAGLAIVSATAAGGPGPGVSEDFNVQLNGAQPFIPGDGNSNQKFARTTIIEDDGNTVEIAIKAKERFIGDLDDSNITGDVYTVPAGFSVTSASDPTLDTSRAWWNFDSSVNLGTRTINDTTIEFSIADPQGDVYTGIPSLTQPTPSASLLQASSNIGFDFLNTGLGSSTGGLGTFDAFLLGDYTIRIGVRDGAPAAPGALIGERTIIVRVVPAPGALALLGVAGFAGVRRRR